MFYYSDQALTQLSLCKLNNSLDPFLIWLVYHGFPKTFPERFLVILSSIKNHKHHSNNILRRKKSSTQCASAPLALSTPAHFTQTPDQPTTLQCFDSERVKLLYCPRFECSEVNALGDKRECYIQREKGDILYQYTLVEKSQTVFLTFKNVKSVLVVLQKVWAFKRLVQFLIKLCCGLFLHLSQTMGKCIIFSQIITQHGLIVCRQRTLPWVVSPQSPSLSQETPVYVLHLVMGSRITFWTVVVMFI